MNDHLGMVKVGADPLAGGHSNGMGLLQAQVFVQLQMQLNKGSLARLTVRRS